MKYIVFSFNYPTLCRALRYIDTIWGRDNTTLLYTDLVSPFPEALGNDYNVQLIDGKKRSTLNGIRGVLADILFCKQAWQIFKKIADNISGEFTFVVFRDNEPQEATIIQRALKRYKQRMHLWIIEEGAGLYAKNRVPVKKKSLKKIAYGLTGVSLYALSDKPQGMCTAIEKIIASQPGALKEKYDGVHVEIEKQIDIFVSVFNKRFSEYVLGQSQNQEEYQFVLLTIPISDFTKEQYWGGTEEYEALVADLINITEKHGKLLIKSHPRDYTDYSKFEKEGVVKVCTAMENSVPYECLAEYYGNPQMITFGSSASMNNRSNKPSICIRNLLKSAHFEDTCSDEYYSSNNIKIVNTFEDLQHVLA